MTEKLRYCPSCHLVFHQTWNDPYRWLEPESCPKCKTGHIKIGTEPDNFWNPPSEKVTP